MICISVVNIFQEETINFSRLGKKPCCSEVVVLFCLFFRRDIKQIDSYPFSSPLFTNRKRVAIPESTKTTPDENFNKKSKLISHSDSSEMLEGQTSAQKDSVQQKRKNRDSETEKTTNVSAVMFSFLLNRIKLFHLCKLKIENM